METVEPLAVLISDIHFTVATLELAATSLLRAQFKAKILDVPLVVLGDTLDSKSMIRAECANKLIQLLSVVDAPTTIVIVGNHDLCNEKSKDHSLNFLKPYCTVIDAPQIGYLNETACLIIPYQSDIKVLRAILDDTDNPRLVLMHQGIQGSNSGDYIQDRSAITKEDVADYRIISGHYHARQDIKCGRPRKNAIGLYSYVGNPYTLNFGEANDPEKGFQILMSDGTLEFVPTNLRKHVSIDLTIDDITSIRKFDIKENDLVRIRISGPKEKLRMLTKESISKICYIPTTFRLDLVPTDTESTAVRHIANKAEMLDKIIDDSANLSADAKARIKAYWKSL